MGMRAGPAAADEWSDADSMMVRVPPSAFPELATSLVRWLTKCGCQIPQPYEQPKGERANVIHGEFDHRGQTDWAVLCSRNRVSIPEDKDAGNTVSGAEHRPISL